MSIIGCKIMVADLEVMALRREEAAKTIRLNEMPILNKVFTCGRLPCIGTTEYNILASKLMYLLIGQGLQIKQIV